MEDGSDESLIGLIKNLFRKRGHFGNSEDLAEEIHDLMDEGQARGLISDEESDMVAAILSLKETRANSIMIPRTDISTASVDATLGEIIELVNECGHTRIPIHKESIDQIVGILHAKDLLKLWGRDVTSKIPRDILRVPYFVPETQKISQLFHDLKEKMVHLAILTDEYGGTAGIITIEDILEEIVGEIRDEHDKDELLMEPLDDRNLLVDAKLEIRKLEDYLDIEMGNGEFESVGGFIIHKLGRIPKVGETLSFRDLEMTIKKADQRKIDEVLITRQNPPASSISERHI